MKERKKERKEGFKERTKGTEGRKRHMERRTIFKESPRKKEREDLREAGKGGSEAGRKN